MPKTKSTTENPAEQGEPADDDVVGPPEPLGEDGAEEAGIARAGVVVATHVKYVGTAHVRKISKADWRQAGVEDQAAVEWDNRVRGKNVVPVTELSGGALEYLDLIDDGFVLVDENGRKV